MNLVTILERQNRLMEHVYLISEKQDRMMAEIERNRLQVQELKDIIIIINNNNNRSSDTVINN